jgi:hypothetical protein
MGPQQHEANALLAAPPDNLQHHYHKSGWDSKYDAFKKGIDLSIPQVRAGSGKNLDFLG